MVQTVISAAQDPNQVLAFNYASEALNNSFFLETLVRPIPSSQTLISDFLTFPSQKPLPDGTTSHIDALTGTALKSKILYSYGNVEHLISTVGAAALGMFSSGWLWLVTDPSGELAVLPTFGPSTLLLRSSEPVLPPHWQGTLGSDDFVSTGQSLSSFAAASAKAAAAPAVPEEQEPELSPALTQRMGESGQPPASSPVSGTSHPAPPLNPSTPSRSFMTASRPTRDAPGARKPNSIHSSPSTNPIEQDPRRLSERIFPLFCMSVHERMWVGAGYGVWGKEEYVRRFFGVLDWEKVARAYMKWAPASDEDMRRRVKATGTTGKL